MRDASVGGAESTALISAAGSGQEDRRERNSLGMLLIVAQKTATALLLWSAFVLLLVARGSDPQTFVTHAIVGLFRGNPPGIAIRWIASNMGFATSGQMMRISFATGAYALVESVEAFGLFLRARWAEWLVVLVTVSFIPIEILEITGRPTPIKVGTLVINLAILVYLIRQLQAKRAQESA